MSETRMEMYPLANEIGQFLPISKFPVTGLSVLFRVKGETGIRKGKTSFIGAVDNNYKTMIIFLGEDYHESNKFYPMEKVTYWIER